MITEDYCSFELSKLLKEKGFDGRCVGCYWDSKKILNIHYELLSYSDGDLRDEVILAPTHQMAMKWLRKKHKIDISVTPDDGSWWIKVTELESWSCVFNGKVLNSDDIKYAYKGNTTTKEGCYEAGLWYVLKNLI